MRLRGQKTQHRAPNYSESPSRRRNKSQTVQLRNHVFGGFPVPHAVKERLRLFSAWFRDKIHIFRDVLTYALLLRAPLADSLWHTIN